MANLVNYPHPHNLVFLEKTLAECIFLARFLGIYQPGAIPQPVVYPQQYGRPYYGGGGDTCCWAL
jgi:hypothetical protein